MPSLAPDPESFRLRRIVLFAPLLALLAACGQSGPLFLPEEHAAPAQETTQAEEEEGDETTP